MKQIIIGAVLLAAFVVVSTMDYYDAVEREESMRDVVRFVKSSCIPTKLSQHAVTKIRPDGTLQCSIYESTKLVMAEAMNTTGE